MANTPQRYEFYMTVEGMLSSAHGAGKDSTSFLNIITDTQVFLQTNWPLIFQTLQDDPLTVEEETRVEEILKEIEKLQNLAKSKISWINDFQKYIQLSLDKMP